MAFKTNSAKKLGYYSLIVYANERTTQKGNKFISYSAKPNFIQRADEELNLLEGFAFNSEYPDATERVNVRFNIGKAALDKQLTKEGCYRVECLAKGLNYKDPKEGDKYGTIWIHAEDITEVTEFTLKRRDNEQVVA